MRESRSASSRIRPWHVAGIVLVAAVIVLVGYAFWPSLTGQTEAATTRPDTERVVSRARVDVLVVQPTDFILRSEATGHLAPWRIAEISAEGSGLVRDRPIEEGYLVAEGSVLLKLDDAEQQITLREAESDLLSAQIEYSGITGRSSGTESDTTQVAAARSQYRRAERAFSSGDITQTEFVVARHEYEAVVLRSGMRRDAVLAVVSGLTQAEQRVERARLMLSRSVVYAPFAGRIADLITEVGQRVNIGQKILTLLDDSRMKVDVDVLEADLVHLTRGATARVRIPALADTVLIGSIYSINPSVNPATGTGRVRVAISNPQGKLVSGLFAYIELETGRIAERLVIPTEAVLVRQGRDLVFVVEDGRAKWVYVTVGQRSGDLVEIVEPIAPGDSVAVAGHHSLAHDALVEVGTVQELNEQ